MSGAFLWTPLRAGRCLEASQQHELFDARRFTGALSDVATVYSYDSWRDPIRNGDCHDFSVSSAGFSDTVRCNLEASEANKVTQKLSS